MTDEAAQRGSNMRDEETYQGSGFTGTRLGEPAQQRVVEPSLTSQPQSNPPAAHQDGATQFNIAFLAVIAALAVGGVFAAGGPSQVVSDVKNELGLNQPTTPQQAVGVVTPTPAATQPTEVADYWTRVEAAEGGDCTIVYGLPPDCREWTRGSYGEYQEICYDTHQPPPMGTATTTLVCMGKAGAYAGAGPYRRSPCEGYWWQTYVGGYGMGGGYDMYRCHTQADGCPSEQVPVYISSFIGTGYLCIWAKDSPCVIDGGLPGYIHESLPDGRYYCTADPNYTPPAPEVCRTSADYDAGDCVPMSCPEGTMLIAVGHEPYRDEDYIYECQP